MRYWRDVAAVLSRHDTRIGWYMRAQTRQTPMLAVTMARRRRTYGLSFSWRRLVGVSAAKGRIARFTRIPLTKQGFQRKVGRMLLKLLGL